MNIKNIIKYALIKTKYPEFNKIPFKAKSDKLHLKSAMEWIALAHDITGNQGVSAAYYLEQNKWGKSYVETTGYIIPTFLNYYLLTKKSKFLQEAKCMADWEISMQAKDGAFGEFDNFDKLNKKIFNTGQVIFGLCSMYIVTRNSKYLSAAIKAGNWLVRMQDISGAWIKYTTQGAKTYHARVDWALLELYSLTKIKKFQVTAQKNLNWVLQQQMSNGWFKNTSLSEKDKPWTHLIAYTIRGLLECSFLLKGNLKKRTFQSAKLASEKMLEIYSNNGFNHLPCVINKDWLSNDKNTCLTGNCQIAIIWLRFYSITKDLKYKNAAKKIINQVKTIQIIGKNNKGIRNISGGILGCYPLNGNYCAYMIINWATKFFADSLMMKMQSNLKYHG